MTKKTDPEAAGPAPDPEAADPAPDPEAAGPAPDTPTPDPAPDTPAAAAPESYEQAMQELRDILSQLEQEDTDVDRLGELVARAAVLIRFCRKRLNKAEMQVNDVIASLADLDDGSAGNLAGDSDS